MIKTSLVAAALAALAFASSAHAQVYRCGDSYSQQPCPGGTLVMAEDTRSPAQRAQTSQAAQRDAKAADAMEKARLKEEAQPAQVQLPPAKLEPVAAEEKPIMTKPKKPQYFTAVAPGTKPKAKKAKAKKPKTAAQAA